MVHDGQTSNHPNTPEGISNMTIYTIYKATNLINGKVYIGFDSVWPKRRADHIRQSKDPKQQFHHALAKYGIENFSWEVIYQSLDGKHCLSEMESQFIQEYNSFGKMGYNMTSGGEGILGYKHNMITKQKISDFMSNRTVSEKTKKLFSESQKGNKHCVGRIVSDETREKISNRAKNRPCSKETREKISKSRKGQRLSEETKRKLSIAATGKTRLKAY